MRDPAGEVLVGAREVLRELVYPLPGNHFLHSPAAKAIVAKGLLTPYEFTSDTRLLSRRVPFVSFPYEWTHGQLHQAAHLTLDVMEAAVHEGHELKDASAFNVLFNGATPEFCDHTSFVPTANKYWWAYAQYLRHFLAPLACSRWRGMPVASVFRQSLDGIGPEAARQLLGWHRWTNRMGWALLQSTRPNSTHSARNNKPVSRTGLIQFLRWQLDALRRPSRHPSNWSNYEASRTHYELSALTLKRNLIGNWVQSMQPQFVIDLGCNRGEFSQMVVETATTVVAVDADEACLEDLHRLAHASGHPISTVLASLDDPAPARGWNGEEFPSLMERLRHQGDLVFCLALLHHLVLGASIPIERVAALMAELTHAYLVVEFIPPDDAMARTIATSRGRTDLHVALDMNRQRRAFDLHFDTLEIQALNTGGRVLALLRNRAKP